MMHISDQVRAALLSDGWQSRPNRTYRKKIQGFAPAGTVSDGTRVVVLTICERGRYLSRIDGCNVVKKDVDLREYAERPAAAIVAVLKD